MKGEDIVFDSDIVALNVDHIMKGTALPIFYPPVEIGGRELVGVSANLPIACLLSEEPTDPVTCIRVDLFSTEGAVPASLDGALGRTTAPLFAKSASMGLPR
jgi:predicted acylesterase/phospholipase RssA